MSSTVNIIKALDLLYAGTRLVAEINRANTEIADLLAEANRTGNDIPAKDIKRIQALRENEVSRWNSGVKSVSVDDVAIGEDSTGGT